MANSLQLDPDLILAIARAYKEIDSGHSQPEATNLNQQPQPQSVDTFYPRPPSRHSQQHSIHPRFHNITQPTNSRTRAQTLHQGFETVLAKLDQVLVHQKEIDERREASSRKTTTEIQATKDIINKLVWLLEALTNSTKPSSVQQNIQAPAPMSRPHVSNSSPQLASQNGNEYMEEFSDYNLTNLLSSNLADG
ncbi:hypothetical protein F5884DRAFT_251730 [Xylogone sp. PMI_703]|nr:hypothetical protein F5884DRAFT_251730 [Xylogone sp. PMI_703]